MRVYQLIFGNKQQMFEKKANTSKNPKAQHFESSLTNNLIKQLPLQERLEEILLTLELQAESNRKDFYRMKTQLQTKITEKDTFIEYLLKINADLLTQNEKLQKKLSTSINHMQDRRKEEKLKFSKQKEEMASVITYLQNRNERLIQEMYQSGLPNRKSQQSLSSEWIYGGSYKGPDSTLDNPQKLHYYPSKLDSESTIFSRCTSLKHLYNQNEDSNERKLENLKQSATFLKTPIKNLNKPKKLRTQKSSRFVGHKKMFKNF